MMPRWVAFGLGEGILGEGRAAMLDDAW